MASWLLSCGRTANKPTYFDIRLERSTLELRDDEDTSYGHLNGTIVLCLNKPLHTKDIKLHLRGNQYAKLNPRTLAGQYTTPACGEATFHHQVWNFLWGSNNREVLQPGNYEFPFSITLHNTMPESVEGLDDCYVHYDLTATINCAWGVIQESTTLKVTRTPDFLSFLEPQSIEQPWPDKLMYEICIPGRSFSLGDQIPVEFRYIALRKGVHPSSIQLQLVESHTLKPTGPGASPLPQTRSKIRVEDDCSYEPSSGTALTTEDMEEWRLISHTLPLTTGLCLPSCQTIIVDVKHSLDITIMIQNPEGHLSKICASFPVSLCLPSETNSTGLSPDSLCEYNAEPPPPYTEYLRDEEYCPAAVRVCFP